LTTETIVGITTLAQSSSAAIGTTVLGPLGIIGANLTTAGTALFFTPAGFVVLIGSAVALGVGCLIKFICSGEVTTQ
jgi:hypothetical protein